MIAFSKENEGTSLCSIEKHRPLKNKLVMVQTINPDPRMRISAQNERSKTELLFLCDASKLRLLSFEKWKGAN